MASTKIDELQLQISSDATTAIKELDALAGALEKAAEKATALSSSSSILSNFANGLERIASVNLNSAIDNLTKLSKLDLSNLKDKTVQINFKVKGIDDAERLKYAQADAAKDIAKNSMTIAKSLGQKYNVDTDGIKQLSSLVKEFAKDLANGGDGAAAQSKMFDVIKERGKETEASLMGMTDQYKNFLAWYNSTKFSSTGVSDITGKGERFSGSILRNLDNSAESADSAFGEMLSKFPDLFAELGSSALNAANIIKVAAQKADEARMMLEPHQIFDEDTLTMAEESVNSEMEKAASKFGENTQKYMRESANNIPLDISVDQHRFEAQIQSAINEATKKKYTSKPIEIELNTGQLRQNIEQAIAMVDFGKLPQTAQSFKDMSAALAVMNQVSLKDTGISQFTNALRRLMDVDTSKFNVTVLNRIVAVIVEMSKVSGIDKTINRFVSSLARLANAGDKTKQTSDGLRILVPRLREAIKSFQSIGTIDGKVNQFIAGLASLANAGKKATITAYNLRALTREVMLFLKSLRNAPQINTNLAMTINGLGNLAAAGQKTGKALEEVGNVSNQSNKLLNSSISTAANSIANSFKKVLNIALKLGSSGAKALGSFMQKLGLLPSMSGGIDRTVLSFGNLLRTIVPFYGIKGIFDWAKGAAEAGSAIVEVENVIDTSFGKIKDGYADISGYIYKWAQTTIDTFGVSELAAKQYAGRLMAMFNSSGFDATEGMRDSAAKMTTDLIERAGDVASFYDIDLSEAMTKFQAGLAGQVRPLRALGINMSVANMEAFAMSQGINTSWKEMDQASQMALRYQYILYATQYAQGDFQRTSMSMANQVRLLKLNFQMLSTTIGQGLVSAIAPAISWLNALIKRLIQAANAFRTFMWTLFGKPLAAAKGVVNEMAGYMDDAADSASDLGGAGGGASDGLGSAADSAKELKKNLSLLPFDELNQLAKDTDSAGSGGSGGGGGGGGGAGGIGDLGLGDLSGLDVESSPAVEAINRWAAAMREAFEKHQWKKLGAIVADGINTGFQYIYDVLNWERIKPIIVDGFIHPFQDFFNSMMKNIKWDLIGATLARGLNIIVYTLREWITGFEWREYGTYLATGLNSLIDEWDADAFGRLIADKFKAAWDFFGGWVETFDFDDFGQKLKEGFHGAIDELDPEDMGKSFGEFLNGISDTIISFLGDEQVKNDLADAFSELVNGFLESFDEEDAAYALTLFRTTLTGAIGKALGKIDKSELAYKLATVLSSLPWGEIALIIGAKAGGAIAMGIFGTVFKNKAVEIISGLFSKGSVGAGASASGGAAGSAAAGSSGGGIAGFAVSMAPFAAVMAGIAGIGTAMRKFADANGGVKQGANLNVDQSFGTTQTAPKAQNAAGSSTAIQTQPITATPAVSKATQIVETILTGVKDPSFVNLETSKAALIDIPVVKKTMDGITTKLFDTAYEKFTNTKLYDVIKKFSGEDGNGFLDKFSKYIYTKTHDVIKWFSGADGNGFLDKFSKYIYTRAHNVTKWFTGQDGNGFLDKFSKYIYTKAHNVTKWFYGKDGGWFVYYSSKYASIADKTVEITMNIVTTAKRVVASLVGGVRETLANIWTENAKGGLFTRATGFQVFGEAGAEAAIPLERRSTMRRIGKAIVNAGGIGVGGNSELATEIAMRLAPIVMSAVNGQSERPINVNATLYTENNEVLARAVNQGNRSLDKRYNPVAQFSY